MKCKRKNKTDRLAPKNDSHTYTDAHTETETHMQHYIKGRFASTFLLKPYCVIWENSGEWELGRERAIWNERKPIVISDSILNSIWLSVWNVNYLDSNSSSNNGEKQRWWWFWRLPLFVYVEYNSHTEYIYFQWCSWLFRCEYAPYRAVWQPIHSRVWFSKEYGGKRMRQNIQLYNYGLK